MARFQSVAQYVAAQPGPARAILRRVRAALRKALPRAVEAISYQIPTYKLAGKTVIYFAGWKRHYAIYPASARLLAEFKDELAWCEIKGSTIRFPLTQPVPVTLIGRLAKFRAEEVAAAKKG